MITFSQRITNIPILMLLRSALNIIFSLKILLLPTWILSGPKMVFYLETLVWVLVAKYSLGLKKRGSLSMDAIIYYNVIKYKQQYNILLLI